MLATCRKSAGINNYRNVSKKRINLVNKSEQIGLI